MNRCNGTAFVFSVFPKYLPVRLFFLEKLMFYLLGTSLLLGWVLSHPIRVLQYSYMLALDMIPPIRHSTSRVNEIII